MRVEVCLVDGMRNTRVVEMAHADAVRIAYPYDLTPLAVGVNGVPRREAIFLRTDDCDADGRTIYRQEIRT